MQEKFKGIMVRVPEHIHHKLKILAAMQQKSMADVIIGLVEKETIQGMDDIPAIRSLLHGSAAGGLDSDISEEKKTAKKTKIPKREPKINV